MSLDQAIYHFYVVYLKLALWAHQDTYVYDRKQLWLQRSTPEHPRSRALYAVQNLLARGEYVFCPACGWAMHFSQVDMICDSCFEREREVQEEAQPGERIYEELTDLDQWRKA